MFWTPETSAHEKDSTVEQLSELFNPKTPPANGNRDPFLQTGLDRISINSQFSCLEINIHRNSPRYSDTCPWHANHKIFRQLKFNLYPGLYDTFVDRKCHAGWTSGLTRSTKKSQFYSPKGILSYAGDDNIPFHHSLKVWEEMERSRTLSATWAF